MWPLNWQLLGVLVFQWSLYIMLNNVTFIYESIRNWPTFFGQDGSILAKFISGFYEPRQLPGQWTRKMPISSPLHQTSVVNKVFIIRPKTELSLAGPTREIPSVNTKSRAQTRASLDRSGSQLEHRICVTLTARGFSHIINAILWKILSSTFQWSV